MKGITVGLLIAASTLALPAAANEYGASTMGNNTTFTWVLFDSANSSGIRGYACVTRDNLTGVAQSAAMHRYAIGTFEGSRVLQPALAAAVVPDDGEWTRVFTPVAPTGDVWDGVQQLDASQEWPLNNTALSGFGTACVDGGVSGGVRYLEQIHGIDIAEPVSTGP